MKIISTNNNYQYKYKPYCNSFSGKDIKKENGYVMIPEKKYDRDKWLERGLIAILLLIEIFRYFNNKSDFPKL